MKTVKGPVDNIVVVGAGLGGIATAIRLAAAGRRVTVLEREPVPGGRAGVWQSNGHTFDTGPTVLTMPNLIDDLFSILGERTSDWLELEPVTPLYRTYFPDGSTLDIHSDPTRMAEEIRATISAAEAHGYEQFVDFVSKLFVLEMKDFIDRNIDTPIDLLTPNLLRLARTGAFRRLAPKVNSYLKDPRTQRVFSFQAMYAGLSPLDALALYAVITYMDSVAGVYFPKGGMHALPKALVNAATTHGVEFRYRTTARTIERSGERARAVITTEGERIPCDAVVLNADLPVAYRELLGLEPWSVRRLKYSPSCAVLLAGSTATYSKIAHHNIHFGRAWDRTFTELISDQAVMSDPSFFVTNATRSDPSLAPKGAENYYVLFPTPNNRANIDWPEFGPESRDQMVTTLERNGYHGFGDAITVERLTTPQDWEDLGMEAGAPFAASHSFSQTGPFRPGNIWGENVVFVGSGTTPGVGVPMVLISGRLAAQRMIG